jgi:hypothetical protein
VPHRSGRQSDGFQDSDDGRLGHPAGLGPGRHARPPAHKTIRSRLNSGVLVGFPRDVACVNVHWRTGGWEFKSPRSDQLDQIVSQHQLDEIARWGSRGVPAQPGLGCTLKTLLRDPLSPLASWECAGKVDPNHEAPRTQGRGGRRQRSFLHRSSSAKETDPTHPSLRDTAPSFWRRRSAPKLGHVSNEARNR